MWESKQERTVRDREEFNMQTYLYRMRMLARQRIIAAMCLYVANLPKKPYIGLSPVASVEKCSLTQIMSRASRSCVHVSS